MFAEIHIIELNSPSWKPPDWIVSFGRILFGTGIVGLALIGLSVDDFVMGRPPVWPAGISPLSWMTGLSNGFILLAGLVILFRRMIMGAGLIIALQIVLFSLSRHLPVFLRDWTNAYKALGLLGGSLVIACISQPGITYSGDTKRAPAWKTDLFSVGILLLAIFLLACGYAHLKFADFVIRFIPEYIPFHSFWAYFCGLCLLAAGLGLLIPSVRTLDSLLSGLMILAWFFLVHIPRWVANPGNMEDGMGLFESLCFAGILLQISGIRMVYPTHYNTRRGCPHSISQ